MDSTYIVVGIVALVALIGLFLLFKGRGGSEALPPPTETPRIPKPQPHPEKRQPGAPAPESPAAVPPSKAPPAATPSTAPSVLVVPPATAPPPKKVSARPSQPDDVSALKKGLASTRGGFISRLAKIFSGKKEISPELLSEIEEVLLTADVGVRTTQRILDRLSDKLKSKELKDSDRVWQVIRDEAREILAHSKGGIRGAATPTVVLVVGVNGVGKTTTIGKLASKFQQDGKKVLLAAGDTFRAAAVLQLEVWGKRVGVPVVKGKEKSDPASVIFEAVKQAKDQGYDIVLCDTAGRLHTKAPLMEELKKVARSVEKALDGRGADETILVLDATSGQNAVQQVQIFSEAIPLTGIVLTKLDGTAKGGVILGIADEHRVPVRYIGIGERVEDLREFDAQRFVDALFAKPDEDSAVA